jgi:CRP/FNR family transcriptional regulator/CRP/FNR family cyclic AMP-dependent transcriptional regulator
MTEATGPLSDPAGIAEALAAVPALAGASHRALQLLAGATKAVTFGAGDEIFKQKDLPTEVLIIHSGWIKIVVDYPDGEREEVRSMGPGQVVGELGVLAGHRRTATAIATDDVTVLAIHRDAFAEVYAAETPVAIAMAQAMAPYLLDNDEVAVDLLSLDLRGRVAKRLIQVSGAMKEGQDPAPIVVTAAQLAMMAGGTEQETQRVLDDLATEGVVSVIGDSITLAEIASLRAIAAL